MISFLEEIAVDNTEQDVTEETGETTSPTNESTTTETTNSTNKSTTTANDSNNFNNRITNASNLTNSLNNMQTNFASLLVGGEEERIFYDRKVRPLIDELYFLSIAAQGTSIAAQNFQSNALAKKRYMKLSLDLTYDIIKEAYCVLDILKERNCIYRSIIEADLERCGGNSVNYSMNDKEYEDSFSNEDNINCDED